MQAYRVETTVSQDGILTLENLPLQAGETIEVIILVRPEVRPHSAITLESRGIDQAQAADLRARLSTFADDWESPEMDIYDDYEAPHARLQSG